MDARARTSRQRRGEPAAPGAVAPATCGLRPGELASLPTFPYSAGGRDPDDCAVCQSPFEKNQRVRALPGCNHIFHAGCVDPWLRRKATCPLCRSPVNPQRSLVVESPPPRLPPLVPPLPSSSSTRPSQLFSVEESSWIDLTWPFGDEVFGRLDRAMEPFNHMTELLDRIWS